MRAVSVEKLNLQDKEYKLFFKTPSSYWTRADFVISNTYKLPYVKSLSARRLYYNYHRDLVFLRQILAEESVIAEQWNRLRSNNKTTVDLVIGCPSHNRAPLEYHTGKFLFNWDRGKQWLSTHRTHTTMLYCFENERPWHSCSILNQQLDPQWIK